MESFGELLQSRELQGLLDGLLKANRNAVLLQLLLRGNFSLGVLHIARRVPKRKRRAAINDRKNKFIQISTSKKSKSKIKIEK